MMYCHGLRRCVNLPRQLKPQSTFINNGKLIKKSACCHYSSDTLDHFEGEPDRFRGITVDTTRESCELTTFLAKLDKSIVNWKDNGNRCLWFKVNIKDSGVVPLLAQKGFNFHHARDEFVMMYKWLPTDSKPNLPPACHTNLGVGALVLNPRCQLLAISEQHYDYPHWKLPGGYVERGEGIIDAAVREVREETGVESVFESLITFRHTHNMMFGNSDIYILLLMRALSDKITISQREVRQCQWMSIEEYTNHDHVHAFNRLVVRKAVEYIQRNLRLNLEQKTVTWSTMIRDMCFLVVEDADCK